METSNSSIDYDSDSSTSNFIINSTTYPNLGYHDYGDRDSNGFKLGMYEEIGSTNL